MTLRQRLGNAKGTSILEFLVVFPFLMFIFLVGIELTRAWMTANIAQNAVREGARVAVVTPVANDPITTGTNRINNLLSISSMTIVSGPSVTCTPSCVQNAQVSATVTVQFQTLFPLFLPQIGTYNIRQTSTMRYE
jgi:Flp pilus assembly protein TadG